jgi:hypothetical protein
MGNTVQPSCAFQALANTQTDGFSDVVCNISGIVFMKLFILISQMYCIFG